MNKGDRVIVKDLEHTRLVGIAGELGTVTKTDDPKGGMVVKLDNDPERPIKIWTDNLELQPEG